MLHSVVALKGGNLDGRAGVPCGGQPMRQRWLVAVNHAHAATAEAWRPHRTAVGAKRLLDARHRLDAAVLVGCAGGLLHRSIKPTCACQLENLMEACIRTLGVAHR